MEWCHSIFFTYCPLFWILAFSISLIPSRRYYFFDCLADCFLLCLSIKFPLRFMCSVSFDVVYWLADSVASYVYFFIYSNYAFNLSKSTTWRQSIYFVFPYFISISAFYGFFSIFNDSLNRVFFTGFILVNISGTTMSLIIVITC